MIRILIFILFSTQFVYGQSPIQHEPERLFNQLYSGMSRIEFVKNHKIKKISFLRDTLFSSSIEFDKNGNDIIHFGMENNSVRKSVYKYDEENRRIETKHYNPDESFRYGYYYKFNDGVKEMYKIEDSLLFRKTAFITPENIRIYSEYNEDGTLKLKNFYVYDNEERYLLETRFKGNVINVQYRFEYFDDKKFITKVQFDKNGTKINEKRHLAEIRTDNKLEHFTENNEQLFRIDSFDKNDNLIKMELLDNEGNATRVETSEYNLKGQLSKHVKVDLRRDQKTTFSYKYDDLDRIAIVTKEFEGETEVFKYEYETY
jgi:hypothetical protein